MTEIISAKGAAHYLESIIKGAKERLVLISPYLQVSDVFLQRLNDAARRNVPTTIVYREEKLRADEREKLSQFTDFRFLCLEKLHAKCYFNESEMVITSMNLYEASEGNRELGVRLLAGQDAFASAMEEAESIIQAARPAKWREERGSATGQQAGLFGKSTVAEPKRGFCIRCRRSIHLDPNRPFCGDCYSVWAFYGNEEYEEEFCHDCGADVGTTMSRPLCRPCYNKSAAARATSWF